MHHSCSWGCGLWSPCGWSWRYCTETALSKCCFCPASQNQHSHSVDSAPRLTSCQEHPALSQCSWYELPALSQCWQSKATSLSQCNYPCLVLEVQETWLWNTMAMWCYYHSYACELIHNVIVLQCQVIFTMSIREKQILLQYAIQYISNWWISCMPCPPPHVSRDIMDWH